MWRARPWQILCYGLIVTALWGLPAQAFVGNALLLTEQAESLALRGRVVASTKTRERARDYARLTVDKLLSRKEVDQVSVDLFEAIIEENDYWLSREDYDESFEAARPHMAFVRDQLGEAKESELRWRWAARGESDEDAEEALAKAIEIRNQLVAELESRLEAATPETPASAVTYLRQVAKRMAWSLAELQAQASEWRERCDHGRLEGSD